MDTSIYERMYKSLAELDPHVNTVAISSACCVRGERA